MNSSRLATRALVNKHAGRIAARLIEARHQAQLDGIVLTQKDEWNRRACRLGGERRADTGRDNQRYPPMNQIGRQL